MRAKEEILRDTREDITTEYYKQQSQLWVQYRYIEVLIDIRDVLNERLLEIDRGLHYLYDKT